ncbi:MAG TPA: acyl-CoA dehydrogenase C-terminal domain-containing protein, partial [Burkholderiaceae bacterium]|nr:acyl-CoA dehydrogenase C-terminal domain-containing protein [Burkholderiaceae bacterium]
DASHPDVASIRTALVAGIDDFEAVVEAVCGWPKQDIMGLYAGSVPYLRLAGVVVGGWQMARAAQCAWVQLGKGVDTDFMQAKLTTARFYADHVLSASAGLRASVIHGAPGVLGLEAAQF